MTDENKSHWRLDLQTLVLLGGIGATLVAWGYTLSGLQADTDRNTQAVTKLTQGLERNDSRTALNEVRISSLEKVAIDAAVVRRELEGTITDFKSDIAVIKEILLRIDKDKKP